MARVFENRRWVAQFLNVGEHQLRSEKNVHAIDLLDHRAPQVAIEFARALQCVEKTVRGFHLEEKRKVAGERIEIHQQHPLAAGSLPLEREVGGDRGGAASTLGGHHGDDLRGIRAAAGAVDHGLGARQLSEGGFHLLGGERLNQKIGGSGAQATQDKIGIVRAEQSHHAHARSHSAQLFEQLQREIAVGNSV